MGQRRAQWLIQEVKGLLKLPDKELLKLYKLRRCAVDGGRRIIDGWREKVGVR